MRYFVELAYNGAAYHGWQRQPHCRSVQETLEGNFSMILRRPVEMTGCGRTDTGVHALQYFLHFDFEGDLPPHFLRRVNKMLPDDIAVFRIFEVAADAHARFDAIQRSYRYHLLFRKDPFRQKTATFYPFPERPDLPSMKAAAALLLNYRDFYPFCRSNHDAFTMRCELRRAEWIQPNDHELVFHASADRFLRGMVRLMVGMCINVGLGKLSLEQVSSAMDKQHRLQKAESAAPEGLFLSEVIYPFL